MLLAARDPAHDVWLGDGSLNVTTDGTATYMLDDETGERHEGSADDLRTIMRLFDALPDADYVWPTLSARDLDPLTANLEIEAIAFRSSAKHVQDEVRGPEFVAPLLEMIAAVGGAPVAERPVFSTINCTVAPLAHDGPMTEASIALARAGVPIAIMPMPLMGTTAPMTVAGVAVITLAELLSTVVLLQLAAPGLPPDRLAGAGLRRPPQRALPRRHARGRSRLAGLHRDEQASLRPAHAGRRHRQRRQGLRLPGRHRIEGRPRRAPGRRLSRRTGLHRRRPGHQPGHDRPAQ